MFIFDLQGNVGDFGEEGRAGMRVCCLNVKKYICNLGAWRRFSGIVILPVLYLFSSSQGSQGPAGKPGRPGNTGAPVRFVRHIC